MTTDELLAFVNGQLADAEAELEAERRHQSYDNYYEGMAEGKVRAYEAVLEFLTKA